jgi:hypothetical protein
MRASATALAQLFYEAVLRHFKRDVTLVGRPLVYPSGPYPLGIEGNLNSAIPPAVHEAGHPEQVPSEQANKNHCFIPELYACQVFVHPRNSLARHFPVDLGMNITMVHDVEF